jgi:hypothetical protein
MMRAQLFYVDGWLPCLTSHPFKNILLSERRRALMWAPIPWMSPLPENVWRYVSPSHQPLKLSAESCSSLPLHKDEIHCGTNGTSAEGDIEMDDFTVVGREQQS